MDILLGLQWGDEGKGKIVDFLAEKYHMVARFQGGPNAGHTLNIGGKKHVLRQIPSGIFRSETTNLIGNGMVLDLVTLKKELVELENMGITVRQNLFISKKAQLILPAHRLLDAAQEHAKGDHKIGSTLRGISPAYQDKTGRSGLRMGDLHQKDFEQKYLERKEDHLEKLKQLDFEVPNWGDLEEDFWDAVEYMMNFQVVDSEYFINDFIQQGKNILAEGAQGTLLDVDFGSYPFVTSSNTSAAGACTGLGVSPRKIEETIGVFKAYCTRVGSGPFPTELFDETGKKMAEIGREFGSVTGRPRRCGWLDLPALQYANMINGTTQLYMMKSDVLNTFSEIKICTHYELPDGTQTDKMPFEIADMPIKPVYKTFKGWEKDISEIKTFEAMPKSFQQYVAFIEQELNLPIPLISVGAERDETVWRKV